MYWPAPRPPYAAANQNDDKQQDPATRAHLSATKKIAGTPDADFKFTNDEIAALGG